MSHAAEKIENETVETGYLMHEIEFPEFPDTWKLEDFADLIPSNDAI